MVVGFIPHWKLCENDQCLLLNAFDINWKWKIIFHIFPTSHKNIFLLKWKWWIDIFAAVWRENGWTSTTTTTTKNMPYLHMKCGWKKRTVGAAAEQEQVGYVCDPRSRKRNEAKKKSSPICNLKRWHRCCWWCCFCCTATNDPIFRCGNVRYWIFILTAATAAAAGWLKLDNVLHPYH